MSGAGPLPAQIALVDDYEVVVLGLAQMLAPYRDRVAVVELDTGRPVGRDVDIALYDTFAQPECDQDDIRALLDNPHAQRVVIYTWSFHPHLIEAARGYGVHGYLAKVVAGARSGGLVGGRARRPGRDQRSAPPSAEHARVELAGPRRGIDRPRIGDPGAD